MKSLFTAAIYSALGLMLAGCAPSAIDPRSVNSSFAGGATGSSLYVVQFFPPAGAVSVQPTSVQVQFSSSAVDATQASLPGNYTMTCGSTSTIASAVSLAGTIATATFASLGGAAGTTCSVVVSPNIYDGYGNYLSGGREADYVIGTTSFSWSELAAPIYTGAAGGGGGATFSDAGANGLALYGLSLNAGSYIAGVAGIWARSDESTAYGTVRGTSPASAALTCPAGYRMTGIFGYYLSYVNAVGIYCQNATHTSTYTSSQVGTASGSYFSYSCSGGQFATVLYGRAGSVVDQIGLGCR